MHLELLAVQHSKAKRGCEYSTAGEPEAFAKTPNRTKPQGLGWKKFRERMRPYGSIPLAIEPTSIMQHNNTSQ